MLERDYIEAMAQLPAEARLLSRVRDERSPEGGKSCIAQAYRDRARYGLFLGSCHSIESKSAPFRRDPFVSAKANELKPRSSRLRPCLARSKRTPIPGSREEAHELRRARPTLDGRGRARSSFRMCVFLPARTERSTGPSIIRQKWADGTRNLPARGPGSNEARDYLRRSRCRSRLLFFGSCGIKKKIIKTSLSAGEERSRPSFLRCIDHKVKVPMLGRLTASLDSTFIN